MHFRLYVLRSLILFLLNILLQSTLNAGQFNANLSYGYEKITSPLVSIDFDSPLILVEDISNLSAHYNQLNLSALQDWEINHQYSFDVSGNALVKDAIETKDLNFSIASIDGTLRKKLGDTTLSIGSSAQRIWVANSNFRDSLSIQTDFTIVKSNGSFTDIYIGLSKNYFVNDFAFFNNRTSTISLTHHLASPEQLINGLDFQASINREKNLKDSEDLSNYSYYGRVSVDKQLAGLTWSVGASINKSYFDKPFSAGFEKRRDDYTSYEFSVERAISDTLSMSLELTKARNSSNLALFDSKYESFNLTLNYNY
jgi:hypothetical protein